MSSAGYFFPAGAGKQRRKPAPGAARAISGVPPVRTEGIEVPRLIRPLGPSKSRRRCKTASAPATASSGDAAGPGCRPGRRRRPRRSGRDRTRGASRSTGSRRPWCRPGPDSERRCCRRPPRPTGDRRAPRPSGPGRQEIRDRLKRVRTVRKQVDHWDGDNGAHSFENPVVEHSAADERSGIGPASGLRPQHFPGRRYLLRCRGWSRGAAQLEHGPVRGTAGPGRRFLENERQPLPLSTRGGYSSRELENRRELARRRSPMSRR